MFEFAIACVPFEMQTISNSIVSPPYKEHRYCPVLTTRGRHTQYLQHEQSYPALVVKPSVLYSAYTNDISVSFDWAALFRRYDDIVIAQEEVIHEENHGDIPWELLDYITDAVPEYKPEHIEHAVAFHNVTDEELPISWLEKGMTVVWNDKFVPKDHPARKHCGEGPFLVVRDESFLIEFTQGAPEKTRSGSNRVVLESVIDQRMTIAHGGYFLMRESQYSDSSKQEGSADAEEYKHAA